MASTLKSILQQRFGFTDFRSEQREVVESVAAGRDTLAVMATGGGKSICFQVPGLFFGGTTLVITPLISLMSDQVKHLREKNIAAAYLSSTLSTEMLQQNLATFSRGQLSFLYLAPERLRGQKFRAYCQKVSISLVVVDEAHCISQWGDDFRPAYRQIASFVSQLPKRPVIIACTASAPPMVRRDIIQSLKLRHPAVYVHSFFRENIHITTKHWPTPTRRDQAILFLLKNRLHGPGIVYTLTRAAAEAWAIRLRHWGFAAAAYHGGLSAGPRARLQTDFISNAVPIITATNAFGMGVDKPDIRWVLHVQIPLTIENYYQEIGRAGRDRQPAEAWLCWTNNDEQLSLDFLANQLRAETAAHGPTRASDTARHHIYQRQMKRFRAMHHYLTHHSCRHFQLSQYFGQSSIKPCQQSCSHCQPQQLLPSRQDRQLYQQLLQQRRKRTNLSFHLPSNHALTRSMAAWLTLIKPTTPQHLIAIPGVGQAWVSNYWSVYAPVIASSIDDDCPSVSSMKC